MSLTKFQREQRISIIDKLLSKELGLLFENINPDSFPGYRDVIKRPMDLTTVKRHLMNNSEYTSHQFNEEMKLIFDNCRKYNQTGIYCSIADELQKLFNHKMEKVVSTPHQKWMQQISNTATKIKLMTKQLCEFVDDTKKSDK